MFYNDGNLPFDSNVSKNELEKSGFVFGELPYDCSLPSGWVEKRIKGSGLFGIFDELGRMRGEMYYCLSGGAKLTMKPRYIVVFRGTFEAGGFCIKDHATNQIVEGGFDLQGESDLWLDEHYPDHKNPFAYW